MAFALALANGVLPAAAEEAPLTPAQEEQVRGIVRDYLLANPEVVYEALKELQRREQQAQKDQQKKGVAEYRTQIFAAPEDASLGNPKARVTVVEFFDYRCAFCRSMVVGLRRLVEEDKDLRIVLKEYPILGPDSIYAARASLAARSHPKFAEFHAALINAPGKIDEAALKKVAGSVGIDFARLAKQMEAPEIQATIDRNLELGKQLNVRGTPAFVIGDSIFEGAMEIDIFKRVVRAARAG